MATLHVSLLAGFLFLADARLAGHSHHHHRHRHLGLLDISPESQPQLSMLEQNQASSGEESADEALANELAKQAEMNEEMEASTTTHPLQKETQLFHQDKSSPVQPVKKGSAAEAELDTKVTARLSQDKAHAKLQKAENASKVKAEPQEMKAGKNEPMDMHAEARVNIADIKMDKKAEQNNSVVDNDEKDEFEELEEQDGKEEVQEIAASAPGSSSKMDSLAVAKDGKKQDKEGRPIGSITKTEDARNGCSLPALASALLFLLLSAHWL